jgi:hypothetical protein
MPHGTRQSAGVADFWFQKSASKFLVNLHRRSNNLISLVIHSEKVTSNYTVSFSFDILTGHVDSVPLLPEKKSA